MTQEPRQEESTSSSPVDRFDQLIGQFARLISTMEEMLSAKEDAEMKTLLTELISIANQTSDALTRVQTQVMELEAATDSVPGALRMFREQYPKDMKTIITRLAEIEASQKVLLSELGLDRP